MLQDSSTSVYRVDFSACNHFPKHLHSERGLCIADSAKSHKRVKFVFPTNEIPHLWAHAVQPEGRNSQRNLFFENGVVYSYGTHFPIARHVYRESGKIRHAVLFTTESYSNTTARHLSMVRQAIPPSIPVFNVPFVGTRDEHTRNLESYQTRICLAIQKSARARSSWQKEFSHDSAVALPADCKAYARFFDQPCPKLPKVPALDSAEMERYRKAEASKAAKQALETKQRAIAEAKAQAERIENWRKGENVGTWSLPYSLPVMFRIVNGAVETSKGARVPVSHAKRALKFVRSVVASGVEFVTNGHTFHVGEYRLDRVEPNGTVHAGCHTILLDEIERLVPLLESTPDEA